MKTKIIETISAGSHPLYELVLIDGGLYLRSAERPMERIKLIPSVIPTLI